MPKKIRKVNYFDLLSVQKKAEQILRKVCPQISQDSGIYFYIREEEGKKYFYIGKATNLLERSINHLIGNKQRIDGSLKKRGFYSADNQMGWKFNVLKVPQSELDKWERHYIDNYIKAGYIPYNIESGGTDGKTDINQRKLGRGYYDGIEQGEKNTREKVKTYFDKYLDFSIKGKPNKIKERKLVEFSDFLSDKPKIEDSGSE